MIEVAVAIAVIAILAGAVAPLALRALNQQRAQKTRDNLQVAYEALVGGRALATPSMRADFGFTPPAALPDLRFMTRRNPPAAYRNGNVPVAYGAVLQGFAYGWNGPYWTGSTDANGAPLDAWGRALRWAANQVQSAGMDGTWGTADDIVYPNPASAPAGANLSVSVERFLPPPPPAPAAVTLQITVYDRNANTTRTRVVAPSMAFAGSGSQSLAAPVAVTPGPIAVSLRSVPANPAYNQDQLLTVNPGGSQNLLFRINN